MKNANSNSMFKNLVRAMVVGIVLINVGASVAHAGWGDSAPVRNPRCPEVVAAVRG